MLSSLRVVVGLVALADVGTRVVSGQHLPLPALPYAYDALEPYVDEATMRIHHTKHHQAYTDKMNVALETLRSDPATKALAKSGIDAVLQLLDEVSVLNPGAAKVLRNHGGGFVNHDMFWNIMAPVGAGNFSDSSVIARGLTKKFGSYGGFRDAFANSSVAVFGSGWAWLSLDLKSVAAARTAAGKDAVDDEFAFPFLEITTTANQDTPAMENGKVPLLCLDVWEHAYYLKHQNRRPDYIRDWFNVINWPEVNRRFEAALKHLHSTKSVDEIRTAHILPTGAAGAAASGSGRTEPEL